jgi:hypothetical protein
MGTTCRLLGMPRWAAVDTFASVHCGKGNSKLTNTMTLRLLASMVVLTLIVACTSTPPNYDADATETNGRVVNRSIVGDFSRNVQPTGIDGTRAVGGYLGYILARRLFDQQTTVTLFE